MVKLYAEESDSWVFQSYVASGVKVVTDVITRMELWVALRRKEADGDLAEGVAQEGLRRFDRDAGTGRILVLARDASAALEFENIINECYGADPRINLRTLDAIHLASARLSRETEMVTTDRRLRDAARRFGFTLFPAEPPPAA